MKCSSFSACFKSTAESFALCFVDAVVRSVYYKYFHPKEALVCNGVLNRAISRAAGKYVPGLDDDEKDGISSMSQ